MRHQAEDSEEEEEAEAKSQNQFDTMVYLHFSKNFPLACLL
jgi:hypothetical protein